MSKLRKLDIREAQHWQIVLSNPVVTFDLAYSMNSLIVTLKKTNKTTAYISTEFIDMWVILTFFSNFHIYFTPYKVSQTLHDI